MPTAFSRAATNGAKASVGVSAGIVEPSSPTLEVGGAGGMGGIERRGHVMAEDFLTHTAHALLQYKLVLSINCV